MRLPVKCAKRVGVLAFCFFLVKGLLWLIVPAVAMWFGWGR